MTQTEINNMVSKTFTTTVDLVNIPKGTLGTVVRVPYGQCYQPNFPLVRFSNGVERIVSPNVLVAS